MSLEERVERADWGVINLDRYAGLEVLSTLYVIARTL